MYDPTELLDSRLRVMPVSESHHHWMVTLDGSYMLRIFDERDDAELYCRVLEATDLLNPDASVREEVLLDRVA